MMREPLLPLAVSLPCARSRRVRWVLLLTLCVIAMSCGGCSFLEDEFTWLDRAAPSTSEAPDAAPSGLQAGY